MVKLSNVVPYKYVSASSTDPNFIGKVICFLQIFPPVQSIGPLPPKYFVSAKKIARPRRFELTFENILPMKMIKKDFPKCSYIKYKIKC